VSDVRDGTVHFIFRLNTETHMRPINPIFSSYVLYFWHVSYNNLPMQWDDCSMSSLKMRHEKCTTENARVEPIESQNALRYLFSLRV